LRETTKPVSLEGTSKAHLCSAPPSSTVNAAGDRRRTV